MNRQAGTFHQLHRQGLLRLPNAFDAGSARLIESLGAPAIATTSAGVAWAHGYRDGDALPVSRVLDTVRAIARVVRVPVSADIEGGYSDDPAEVGETVAALIDAGAVGINIEDGDGDPSRLCAKIEAARTAAARCGVELFINARTDVYLRGLGAEGERVELALQRGGRYAQSGADGLFVPGVHRPEEIAAVVAGTGLPVNVMARPGLPPAAELERLGVRRLSAGASLAIALQSRLAALALGFLDDAAPGDGPELGYPEINALFPD